MTLLDDAPTWGSLVSTSTVDIGRGGDDDPLAGVVRIARHGELDVDVVVGKALWQRVRTERSAR